MIIDFKVRNLGAFCDNPMDIESHVNKVCQTVYIYEKIAKHLTSYIKRCMRVLITCLHKLTVNAIPYGLPTFLIERFKNFVSLMIIGSHKYDQMIPVFK